jgi:hypothetical protein
MPSRDFDTAAKRSRLRPRKNPYWFGISGGRGGLSLGFRRTVKGDGVWVAKIVIDGRRIEEGIGTPDGDGTVPGGLTFPAAVEVALGWGRRQAASVVVASELASVGQIPTVRLAVKTYVDMRRARADRSGSEGSLKLHVTNDQEFAGLKLGRLEAQNIVDWRERLPNELEPSSINRILNDLRAALNASATKHRRQLPAHILAEIKLGTKAVAITSSPRRQLLTDEQVRAVVDAAFEVDPSGDFGRLVLLAAATGARLSVANRAGEIIQWTAAYSRPNCFASVRASRMSAKCPRRATTSSLSSAFSMWAIRRFSAGPRARTCVHLMINGGGPVVGPRCDEARTLPDGGGQQSPSARLRCRRSRLSMHSPPPSSRRCRDERCGRGGGLW